MIHFSNFAANSRLVLACIVTLLGVGCGGLHTDYSQLDLAEVSGTITLDGEPLPNARVKFENETGGYSYGLTDDSGAYTLMFNSEKSGIQPGEKTVRIFTVGGGPEFSLGQEEMVEEDPDAPTEQEIIPAKYNSESELTETVESGSQTINFDLQSK
ncbi:carboxypeptidase-like regulatory domain-containing protein [Thalassoroseus pseudoceratinae]|uniref:carboxypeptidase-like regulatory domain-containing protein n=1 Tax=Thalassoroseus pseudoceratinae TaxID=2713176 RepID=UPI00197F883D|nr:carboxypeptidase-like regulatory domain-containing protein [Thalassoroseus pseudoceratinae]